MTSDFRIQALSIENIEIIRGISAANNTSKDDLYWRQCAEKLETGEIDIFLALQDKVPVGYVLFNRHPKYRLYQQLNIPEIQDLNVMQDYRKQGIGSSIIAHCEEHARINGYTQCGISFALTKEFGAAQRLYIALGYIPDGYGLTYDRVTVATGQFHAIDEDLCLMLVKDL